MSEKIDTFCNTMKERLTSVDEKLTRLRSSVETVRKEDEAAIRARLDHAKKTFEARRKEDEEARERFHERIQEKKEEVQARVDEWKKQRDTKKLVARAEAAEQRALAEIDYADGA